MRLTSRRGCRSHTCAHLQTAPSFGPSSLIHFFGTFFVLKILTLIEFYFLRSLKYGLSADCSFLRSHAALYSFFPSFSLPQSLL